MSDEAKALLATAARGVQWLHSISQTSHAAERLWVNMSALLVKAGERVGVDLGAELPPTSDAHQPSEPWLSSPGIVSVPVTDHDLSNRTVAFSDPMPPTPFTHYHSHQGGVMPQDQPLYHNPIRPETLAAFGFDQRFDGQNGGPVTFPSSADGGEDGASELAAQMMMQGTPSAGPWATW